VRARWVIPNGFPGKGGRFVDVGFAVPTSFVATHDDTHAVQQRVSLGRHCTDLQVRRRKTPSGFEMPSGDIFPSGTVFWCLTALG
jgi:hypothetical protein